MARKKQEILNKMFMSRSLKRKSKDIIGSVAGNYGGGYKIAYGWFGKNDAASVVKGYDKMVKDYNAIKNPSEGDRLRLLGALDAADGAGVLQKKHNTLTTSLRKELYPLIKTDVVTNPLDYSSRDIGLALIGTAAGMSTTFTRSLTKNKDIAKILVDIAKKEKIPLKRLIVATPQTFFGKFIPKSNFDPATKTILTTPSEAVGLHELGHAADFKSKSKLKRILGITLGDIPIVKKVANRVLPYAVANSPLLLSAAVAPFMSNTVREKLKGKDKGSLRSKIISKITEENPWSLGLAAYSPILYREGKASKFALQQLKKLRGWGGVAKGLATLAPAFIMHAAGAGLAANLTNRIVRHQEAMEKVRKSVKKNK